MDRATKIVIVGGVAGGASAATRARRMDERAEIILIEKDAHVSFANCGLPYYIGEEITRREALLVATPEFLRRRFRLDVRTDEEVLAIDRQQKTVRIRRSADGQEYEQAYDKLILTPGASPLVPPLSGVEATNVMTLRNVADTDRIKAVVDGRPQGRATVVGAGFIGLEMVEQLVHRGWEVTLVELQPQVLPLLDAEMAFPIAKELTDRGVQLRLGGGLQAIKQDADGLASAVELASGESIPTDLVIIGIGVRPNTQLAVQAGLEIGKTGGILVDRWLKTSDPDIYAAGDAAEYPYGPTGEPSRVPLAGPANRAGRIAGQHAVSGQADPLQDVWGTSIVRVFGVTAGMTGLTKKGADRFGIPAITVSVVGKHHAGYYPGAEEMVLKLAYDPTNGKILGLQAVGGEGVDKRLDVIATLLHFGGTVRDLAGLDLAYAPPFGAAKDPLHQAAFAACNQLDGFTTFCDADADLTDLQVIDVRTPAEVSAAPLAGVPHALQIPVDDLRDSLHLLDKQRPVVVSCGVGLRGHVAARILTQHGFDVRNLAGGAKLRNLAQAAH